MNDGISFEILFDTISNENRRKELIDDGHKHAKEFLEKIKD